MSNHTTKAIPLPKGWDEFVAKQETPTGCPPKDEGWLSVEGLAVALDRAESTARAILVKGAKKGELEVQARLIGRAIVKFYRPIKKNGSRRQSLLPSSKR